MAGMGDVLHDASRCGTNDVHSPTSDDLAGFSTGHGRANSRGTVREGTIVT